MRVLGTLFLGFVGYCFLFSGFFLGRGVGRWIYRIGYVDLMFVGGIFFLGFCCWGRGILVLIRF